MRLGRKILLETELENILAEIPVSCMDHTAYLNSNICSTHNMTLDNTNSGSDIGSDSGRGLPPVGGSLP